MNTVAGTRFAIKPVVAALALAFSAVNAYADPTPTQLPGGGLIRAVNTGTTISSPSVFYVVTGTGTAGDQVVNGSPGAPFFPGSIQLDNAGAVARAVIRWGGNAGSAELFNPQGFNIGQNATVFFTSAATVTSAAVLNIDASGNPSQIFGKLIGTSDTKLGTGVVVPGVGGGAAPAIFVANTNGIIVGPLGQVQSPTGVALIAADLTNTSATPSTAEWDFVGNNGATSPAPPGVSGPSYLDVMGGITNKSKIDIRGFIDGGGALFNQPAAYVLLVGGDVVNTGNIFGSRIDVLAGMRGYSSTTASDTVNGISKVAVQRMFNVDLGLMQVGPGECTTSSACLEVSRTGSTILNTGTISSKTPGGYVSLGASGGASGIRTGTLGDTNPLVGIFSDNALITNTYEPGSTTELYGVLSGYSLNVLLPSLSVNQAGGWNGDVTVHTVQRGTEPSNLTTTGDVLIRGVNVLIDSTINHLPSATSVGNLVSQFGSCRCRLDDHQQGGRCGQPGRDRQLRRGRHQHHCQRDGRPRRRRLWTSRDQQHGRGCAHDHQRRYVVDERPAAVRQHRHQRQRRADDRQQRHLAIRRRQHHQQQERRDHDHRHRQHGRRIEQHGSVLR